MRRLLAIFAHPDDEGAIGGTIARYARNGTQVSLICTTKGEAGEISDPMLATPETLGTVRTAELQSACDILGIHELHFLGFRDSGMAGTPENEDPRSLVQADPDDAIERLVTLIRRLRPDIVITFEPFGWYGHPDHQTTGQFATTAFQQAGDGNIYPTTGQPWQAQRLYQAVIPASFFKLLLEYAEANDIEVGFAEQLPFDILEETEAQVTHVLDVRDFLKLKQDATEVHRTQFGEDDLFLNLPDDVNERISGHEYFIQVYPTPSDDLRQNPATDLFDDDL